MNLDPIDFFPGYDPCRCITVQRRQSSCSNIWTNLIAVLFSVIVCAAGFYYYEIIGKDVFDSWKRPMYDQDVGKVDPLEKLQEEIEMLKGKVDQSETWRQHLEDLYLKIYHKQESAFEKKLEEALDLFDSDRIGLFDYAAIYASGSIYSTPNTIAYPINKTISFFNLIKYSVLSNPDNLLEPHNVPGSCFAFVGNKGRIRIKLGKKITIQAVSMDHIRLYEDRSSAPKDFKVYGLTDPDNEESGKLLGSFIYDINGRPIQTFQIYNNPVFEYVELRILSNYGKEEFTCVYRFRVHNAYVQILTY